MAVASCLRSFWKFLTMSNLTWRNKQFGLFQLLTIFWHHLEIHNFIFVLLIVLCRKNMILQSCWLIHLANFFGSWLPMALMWMLIHHMLRWKSWRCACHCYFLPLVSFTLLCLRVRPCRYFIPLYFPPPLLAHPCSLSLSWNQYERFIYNKLHEISMVTTFITNLNVCFPFFRRVTW